MRGLPALLALALLAPLAAAADEARGRKLFEQCAACHALEAGKTGLGPSLAGLFGRKAGALEEFRYSGPLKRSGIGWTRETIDMLLEDPQKAVPGNRMPFSGMPDKAERADLLDYLEAATK